MIFLLLHARNGNGTNEAAAFEVNREAAAYTCELCRFQTGIGKRIALAAIFRPTRYELCRNMLAVRIFLPSQLRLMGRIDCIA